MQCNWQLEKKKKREIKSACSISSSAQYMLGHYIVIFVNEWRKSIESICNKSSKAIDGI